MGLGLAVVPPHMMIKNPFHILGTSHFFCPNLSLHCHLLIFQMDLRNIPEEVVKETLEYKCLQSQFSLLYNESLGVKTQLDEARALLLTAKNAHLRQIEHMEVRFFEQQS